MPPPSSGTTVTPLNASSAAYRSFISRSTGAVPVNRATTSASSYAGLCCVPVDFRAPKSTSTLAAVASGASFGNGAVVSHLSTSLVSRSTSAISGSANPSPSCLTHGPTGALVCGSEPHANIGCGSSATTRVVPDVPNPAGYRSSDQVQPPPFSSTAARSSGPPLSPAMPRADRSSPAPAASLNAIVPFAIATPASTSSDSVGPPSTLNAKVGASHTPQAPSLIPAVIFSSG